MSAMKFVAALIAIVVMSLVLCAGLWAAAHGYGVWFGLIGLAAFLGMFIRYGCQTH